MNLELRETNFSGRYIVVDNREQLGELERFSDWSFFAKSEDVELSSEQLRAIADKLDELNREKSK